MIGLGNSVIKRKLAGASVPAAPINIVQPSLSGSGAVGVAVICNKGTWSGSPTPTYTYDFRLDSVSVQNSSSNSYTPLLADDGKTLTCLVTATNSQGSASEGTSNSIVIGIAPSNTIAPTLSPSGTQSTGTVITLGNGTFTGTAPLTYAYRWKRNGSIILGETANTYTLVVGDDGTVITAEVKATNAYGESAYIGTSNQVDAVNAIAPVNTVAPVVSGTAVVGQTLSSTTGTWTGIPTPTYSYQWYRGATLISGATNSTYTLVSADAGQNIKCTVTATNTAGSASADSNTLAILATLLDIQSGGVVNYSLRLIRGAYINSPSVRLRRSSDNAEVDVYFDTNFQTSLNSNINSRNSGTTLSTWVGSNSAFVVRWYDQSTNANNLTQTTPANQPTLVSAGVLQTENSEATIAFNATTFLQVNPAWNNTFSIYSIFKLNNTTTLQVPFRDNGATNSTGIVAFPTTNSIYRIRQGLLTPSSTSAAEFGTVRRLVTLSGTSANVGEAFVNNASRATLNPVTGNVGTTMYVGVNGATPSAGLIGNMQTFNIFSNTNVSSINGTLNSIYNVY